jgi:tetratricopeptide (TPR) repeat protein
VLSHSYISTRFPNPIVVCVLVCSLPLLALSFGCGQPEAPQTKGSLARGDQHLEAGDIEVAIAEYRTVLHRDSLNPMVLVRLSKAYAAQGNRHLADTYLQRGTNIPYQRGLDALEAGNDDAARLAFEETISLHPPHPLALNHLGEIQYHRGNVDSAAAYYEQSAKGFSTFSATFLRLGQLYVEKEMTDKAQASFERAIELNINALDAYIGLGQLHLDQSDWEHAVERFDTALVIDPESPLALAGRDHARSKL